MTTLTETADYIKSMPLPITGYTAVMVDDRGKRYPVKRLTMRQLSVTVAKLQRHFHLSLDSVCSL